MQPYHQDPWLTVYQGDCREVMAAMEPESVHCVVTSPPYWGLRDYGTASWDGGNPHCDHLVGPLASSKSGLQGGNVKDTDKIRTNGMPFKGGCGKCGAVRQDSQLGLEPTPEEYVANMVAVFREVRRVLRADGTVWLNLGDSYVAGQGGRQSAVGEMPAAPLYQGATPRKRDDVDTGSWGERDATAKMTPARGTTFLKPKDLVGIPWRVAFALQADGWYLRSDVIWSKPNPMPESVADRPTKAHEYLFLLSKSPRYYYDADAVREPHDDKARPNGVDGLPTRHGERDGLTVNAKPSQAWHSGGQGFYKSEVYYNPAGRNLRSVWSIATQPYPGAHFATFPEKLVEPCIKAGTSERGVCPECGAPWERVVERKAMVIDRSERTHPMGRTRTSGTMLEPATADTVGWVPTCDHAGWHEEAKRPIPATVLDPFAGSGTAGRVAQRLSRRAVLIDLNPAYLLQAMQRNKEIPLGLEAG